MARVSLKKRFEILNLNNENGTEFCCFLRSCTLHGYYSIWSAHQMDNGNEDFSKKLKYNHWRMSWYGYMSLLNIDFGTGWQTCTECGDSPDVVVCDGTSLGFRRNLLKHSVEDSSRRGTALQRTS